MPTSPDFDLQREVTRTALQAVGGRGFVLAGSGAIREHGIVDRVTQDVDLFTDDPDPDAFAAAAGDLLGRLRAEGMVVDEVRRAPQYVQLHVTGPDGGTVEIDLGVDWRAHDPVILSLGPVLSERDAVASKVGALYSRMETRDFLDVDAIRTSGRFSDSELVRAVTERDPGFEVAMFATQLAQVRVVGADRVPDYGVDEAAWAGVAERLGAWSDRLAAGPDRATDAAVAAVAAVTNPETPEPQVH